MVTQEQRLTEELDEMKTLLQQLFRMLDSTEESYNGKVFHPTEIKSCRLMHTTQLNRVLPRLKEMATTERGSQIRRTEYFAVMHDGHVYHLVDIPLGRPIRGRIMYQADQMFQVNYLYDGTRIINCLKDRYSNQHGQEITISDEDFTLLTLRAIPLEDD